MSFYNIPKILEEAYHVLAHGDWQILSGGTDVYPALRDAPIKVDILDISRIRSLRRIEINNNGDIQIGALATWSDILRADLPRAFDGLKLAAREVGSKQIQNRATIGGNLCNASPAADGVPPLLTLGARVKIGSTDGERELPLERFILGNRQTALRPHEMVTGLRIPAGNTRGQSTFLKLGSRKYLVISISMVAMRLVLGSEKKIEEAAVSVGSCSIVAKRLPKLEQLLVGKRLDADLFSRITRDMFDVLSPIDDVRATGTYRLAACQELVKRSLQNCLDGDAQ